MNRRQILLAARTLDAHTPHPTPANLQADLVYLSKLMVAAEDLRWRRGQVIRELARVETTVINQLREDDQDRPMPRRRQRGKFGKPRAILPDSNTGRR